MPSADLVGAIDQGTSSSRFLVFDPSTEKVVCQHQVQTTSIYPREGWVEQDPKELLESVKEVQYKMGKSHSFKRETRL